MRIIMFSLMY